MSWDTVFNLLYFQLMCLDTIRVGLNYYYVHYGLRVVDVGRHHDRSGHTQGTASLFTAIADHTQHDNMEPRENKKTG